MVMKNIDSTKTGVEGSASVCVNGLKIVADLDDRNIVNPNVSTPISPIAFSGQYYTRFVDENDDVNIVSVSGLSVSIADFS